MDKQKKGMRKGVDTKKIMKSMTDDDWRRIEFSKEVAERHIEDDDAHKCAVRTDQMYQQWDEKLGVAQGELFQILSLKSKYDKNLNQLEEGEITEIYPNSAMVMSERDMEINNIVNQQRIGESLRNMWLVLADLYRYVEQQRLDRKEFFTKKQYSDFVRWIKDELAKQDIDLYQERV